MKLFETTHIGNIVVTVAIRLAYYKGEEAVLMIPDNEREQYLQLYNELQKSHLFNKVIMYDYHIGSMEESKDAILTTISSYLDSVFIENGVDETSITEIVSMSDFLDPIGMWGSVNGYKVTLVESGVDLLQCFQRYDAGFIRGESSKAYEHLQKELCIICGESGKYNIINYSFDSISDNNYNYSQLIRLLSTEEKKAILKCYGVDDSTFESINTIVLFNSPKYVESRINMVYKDPYLMMDSELYTYIHRILLWYLRFNELYITIKPHPYGYEDVIKQFPYSTLLGNYPIELIMLYDIKKIPEAVSFGSSSDQKIMDVVNHYYFYYYLYDYFKVIHELMFAIYLIGTLNIGNKLYVNLTKSPSSPSMVEPILLRLGFTHVTVVDNIEVADIFLLSSYHTMPLKYPKNSVIITIDNFYNKKIKDHYEKRLFLFVKEKGEMRQMEIKIFIPNGMVIDWDKIEYKKILEYCELEVLFTGTI